MSVPPVALLNARLVDPERETEVRGGLLVRDGVIAAVGPGVTRDQISDGNADRRLRRRRGFAGSHRHARLRRRAGRRASRDDREPQRGRRRGRRDERRRPAGHPSPGGRSGGGRLHPSPRARRREDPHLPVGRADQGPRRPRDRRDRAPRRGGRDRLLRRAPLGRRGADDAPRDDLRTRLRRADRARLRGSFACRRGRHGGGAEGELARPARLAA